MISCRFAGRRPLFVLSAACLSAALLPACQTGGSSSGEGATEEEVVDDYEPRMGMTREEIVAEYDGEPDSKNVRGAGGEVWTYHTNRGEAFIPFNFGYTPRVDTITFDENGTVVDFTKQR